MNERPEALYSAIHEKPGELFFAAAKVLVAPTQYMLLHSAEFSFI